MINSSYKKGFSIAEVLISFLIFSIALAVFAPVITKKIAAKKQSGIVYTYRTDNKATKENVCFTTNVSSYSDFEEEYESTQDCSEYTFTVPAGVGKINITLAAGGGGGGGASGGTIMTPNTLSASNSTASHSNSSGFIPDLLRSLKINLITASGNSGSDPASITGTLEAGQGGSSSPAILNMIVPKLVMRGINFTNTLKSSPQVEGHLSLSSNADEASAEVYWGNTKNSANTTVFKVKKETNNTYTIQCSAGNSSGNQYCDDSYIIPAIAGEKGQAVGAETYVSNGMFIAGGLGGISPIGTNLYGLGGKGASILVKCPSDGSGNPYEYCKAKDATSNIENDSVEKTSGKGSYALVSYTIERPGGTGGGGAAGTIVRILDFPVVSGETYIIRVGKGGLGGSAGTTSTTPTEGLNGKGGVSSAIYRKDGELLFMVNGGAPGQHGEKYKNTSDYAGNIGTSGRNFAKLFTTLTSSVKLDSELTEKMDSCPDDTEPYITDISKTCLSYKKLQEDPYKKFNQKLDSESIYDNRNGGYSDFVRHSSSLNEYTFKNNIADTTYNDVYDGLYYRAITGNTALYIGGLGGFSGFGGKGGCGGYFQGNYDGRYNSGSGNNDVLKNKFFIANNKGYDIINYFDNCKTNTPEGQSANFVSPDPVILEYGQASSGGGGGGYSMEKGPGNGGNGTDGFVMIDWRK